MMTGMMDPSWLWVLALNCLQNSIMFTPCCPRAGPTGGAGLAFPAGICNLTRVLTSFAKTCPFPLQPLDQRSQNRSEEHTSELQSHSDLVCRLLLEKKKKKKHPHKYPNNH